MRTGLQDGSTKEVSAEGCEFGPPGAPPLPIDAMLGICKNMVGALPDWKSLCLGIEKNEDGTYTVLTQQFFDLFSVLGHCCVVQTYEK